VQVLSLIRRATIMALDEHLTVTKLPPALTPQCAAEHPANVLPGFLAGAPLTGRDTLRLFHESPSARVAPLVH